MNAHVFGAVALWAALSGGVLIADENDAGEPIVPTETIRLFNGQDLAGFYTFCQKTGRDDSARVFRVEEGLLRAGDEDAGYVATERAYKNYHLTVEYKWGRKNPRDKYVRNSGVLLHGVGPDGAAHKVWMTSIECQLAQGCEGDLIVIRGKGEDGQEFPATLTSETVVAADGNTRWSPGGKRVAYNGKQFWWNKHQVDFDELIDHRGKDDVASPLGEWTKVECICREDRITIRINGQTVNEATNVVPAAGRILLQAESHEIFFRNVELRPLDKETE